MNEMTRIVAAPTDEVTTRFSATEFIRMVELGAFEDWKVELIKGELHRMPPPENDHSRMQVEVIAALLGVAPKALVRGETGINLGNDTVLGCDVALIATPQRGNQMVDPRNVQLVVEIAETSRTRDLNLKRRLYAEAAIGVYWVVDDVHAVTYTHRAPVDGEYTEIHTVRFDEPLTVPGTDATITLS